MRLLLDTHALLWWLLADPRLGRAAQDLIADPANDVLVSVASLWEIQVKVRVGKLKADLGAILDAVRDQGFDLVGITPAHLLGLGDLPRHHGDPWDHLLIAQAKAEGAIFVSEDRSVPAYPIAFMSCSGSAPKPPGSPPGSEEA
ncbi:type II toxin-antitoxin system VapC family toxin [Methylobacterium sp. J-078]|uniref:type II toxin-antitoxin system VapC family toxin n=1 Tax=Methylobacterium sp. J-078 TaxID=2836657 RepID=UPI001FBA2E2D|nr:type II toxin-antitoxin system VapC family toxin [Methylobacterium sp. J-078]MCJ2048086.1 type II toxin-antitoxin system VapC family toxin [Methylobacterium sp. J-078]